MKTLRYLVLFALCLPAVAQQINLQRDVTGLLPPANAGLGAAPTAADQIPIATSSTVIAFEQMYNCASDGLHGLTYSTSTHTFVCVTLTVGAPSWASVTNGASAATLTMASGGSLVPGAGTIAANYLNSVSVCVTAPTAGYALLATSTGASCWEPFSGGSVTAFAAPSGSWPSWLVPTVTNASSTPSLAVAASAIPTSALANPSTTVNGQTCTLGASCTIPAAPFSTITGGTNTAAAMVVGSGASLSYSGTGAVNASSIGSVAIVGSAPIAGAQLTATSSTTAAWDAPSVPFTDLTSGTNNVAAMLVTTGASLGYSGTGAINASAVAGTTITGTPSGAGYPFNLGNIYYAPTSTGGSGNWAETIGDTGRFNIWLGTQGNLSAASVPATSSANFGVTGTAWGLGASYWTGTTSAEDTCSWNYTPGSGANPNLVASFMCGGSFTTPSSGTHTIAFGNPFTAPSVNNTIYVIPGSGNDITSAINTAAASSTCSASLVGCTIVLATAGYSAVAWGNPVVITQNNLHIRCDSRVAMIFGTGYPYDALDLEGANDEVEGCTWNASNMSGHQAISVTGANARIHGNTITDTKTPSTSGTLGIRLNVGAVNADVYDNNLNVSYIAYSVGDRAHNENFHDNVNTNSFQCFDFNGSGGSFGVITSFSVTSNVATINGTGFGLYSSGEQITVSGLSVGTYLNGTQVVSSATSTSVTFPITHANVSTTSDAGQTTLYQPDSYGIIFHHNVCTGDISAGYVESASDILIDGNQFSNDGTTSNGATIQVHDSLTTNFHLHVLVDGNTFVGSGSETTAFHVFQSANDWTFSNNTVRGYFGDAVQVDSTQGTPSNGSIHGNRFTDNGQSGSANAAIRLLQSSGNSVTQLNITGNTCIDDTGVPVQVYCLEQSSAGNAASTINVSGNFSTAGSSQITYANFPAGCSNCTVQPPVASFNTAPTAQSCSVGSIATNTAATSASTVLYACYPANTWNAVTVP